MSYDVSYPKSQSIYADVETGYNQRLNNNELEEKCNYIEMKLTRFQASLKELDQVIPTIGSNDDNA